MLGLTWVRPGSIYSTIGPVMNIEEGQWTLKGGEPSPRRQIPVNEDSQPELWTEENWRRFFGEEHAHLDLEGTPGKGK